MTDRIFVGVLRMVLTIPGARSLKDRRQAVLSVKDRVRHRFDVTFHEVDASDRPTRQVAVVTTAGNDQHVIRAALDQIVGFVRGSGKVLLGEVDVDVFRWHPLGLADRLPEPDDVEAGDDAEDDEHEW